MVNFIYNITDYHFLFFVYTYPKSCAGHTLNIQYQNQCLSIIVHSPPIVLLYIQLLLIPFTIIHTDIKRSALRVKRHLRTCTSSVAELHLWNVTNYYPKDGLTAKLWPSTLTIA